MSGQVTRAKAKALAKHSTFFEEMVVNSYPEYSNRPSQYFIELLPGDFRGLVGDAECDGWALVVRPVKTGRRESYATVEPFYFPPKFLNLLVRRLTNEVTNGRRHRFVKVYVEITGKPQATVEPH